MTTQTDWNNMPEEVYWIKCLQISTPYIGIDTYNKALEIQEKHPEYFPWETKYKSIPKEVHEAYSKEAYPETHREPRKVFEDFEKGDGIKAGKGLMETIREGHTTVTNLPTMEEMREAFKDMERREEAHKEKKRKENLRLRKIWKKHYKKYNLDFPNNRMFY